MNHTKSGSLADNAINFYNPADDSQIFLSPWRKEVTGSPQFDIAAHV